MNNLYDEAYITSKEQLNKEIFLPLTVFNDPTTKIIVRKLNIEKEQNYSFVISS